MLALGVLFVNSPSPPGNSWFPPPPPQLGPRCSATVPGTPPWGLPKPPFGSSQALLNPCQKNGQKRSAQREPNLSPWGTTWTLKFIQKWSSDLPTMIKRPSQVGSEKLMEKLWPLCWKMDPNWGPKKHHKSIKSEPKFIKRGPGRC